MFDGPILKRLLKDSTVNNSNNGFENGVNTFSVENFLNQYFTRLPFSMPGGALFLKDFINWQTLEGIFSAAHEDVLFVREGKLFEVQGVSTFADAKQLYDQGHTIVVRHSERSDATIASFAQNFKQELGGEIDVQLYYTPSQLQGFDWHYDAEDVFYLQISGTKEFYLRKNTFNPLPVVDFLPKDMKFEQERSTLQITCRLEPGDWLYIPAGYWHKARNVDQKESMSVSVGVLTPTALEVYAALKNQLLNSVVWRQRLPVLGSANSLAPEILIEQYQKIFSQLGDDLARRLKDPQFARAFINKTNG